MKKKDLVFKLILPAAALITISAVLFFYPYPPTQPPLADDQGATLLGQEKVVQTNNKFAFDLYADLNQSEGENMFYSPYSISSALAMTYEGAQGQTAEEMKSVFNFPEPEELRPNFAAVYNQINASHRDYELKTGNALWTQHNYPFLAEYLKKVEDYYGGKAANLDFVQETEKSRQTINSFIAEQTNEKIKDLIPQGFLDSTTRLVLTNAIYFKGDWEEQFDKKDTQEQDFKISSSTVVKTPMMLLKPEETEFNYANLPDLQILELPYQGEKISMFVLLPQEDLTQIEPSLTWEQFKQWQSQMQKTKMDLIYLPKFKLETKYFLKENLINLGMSAAFNSQLADFSLMTGAKDLFIDFVIHQAFVEVDEKGTEAAAATAVGMKLTAMLPQNIFKADHPFIFIIQDKTTENILFLGKLVNPEE